MDVVYKKAIESKVKKFGRDLGINSGNNASSSGAPAQPWDMFSVGADDDIGPESGLDNSQHENFPPSAAAFFNSRPRNFPPLIRLFFLDRSILTSALRPVVNWAIRVVYIIGICLSINISTNVFFVVARKGTDWYLILISVPIAIILAGFQLFTADTAFRGAYRTSSQLRGRYLLLAGANLIPIIMYALLGFGFFNGWLRISAAGRDESITGALRKTRMIMAAIEAGLWTLALFMQTFSLFEMQSVWRSRDPGLSDEALAATRRGINPSETTSTTTALPTSTTAPPPRPDGREAATRDRIDQIRQKYSSGPRA